MDQRGTGVPRTLAERYQLIEPLGRGGMGVVWRATDTLLDREVAVKEVYVPSALPPAEREELYRRTLREARAAARLRHPNVVTVFDVVEEGERPWIVMDLVRARPLDDVIAAEGLMAPERAANIGRQVLAALMAAHEKGVLHRDVKPANVLISERDRVTLTDFGIAVIEGDTTITQSGQFVGSAAYLAPERVAGEAVGPASDLWSLGATLFMAIEGHGPYDRDSGAMAVLGAILTQEPPLPPHAGALAPVIGGLLVRDPAGRLDAETLAGMLDNVAAGGFPAGAPPTGTNLGSLLSGALPLAPNQTSGPQTPYPPQPTSGPQTPYAAPASGPQAPYASGPQHPYPSQPTSGPQAAYSPPGQPGQPGQPDGPPATGPYGQGPYAQSSLTGPHVAPRRSRTPLVLAVIAVIAVLIVLAVVALRLMHQANSANAQQGTSVHQAPQSVRPASQDPTGPVKVPAGYVRHADPTGFHVVLPKNWTYRTARGHSVTYFNPNHSAYFLVDRTKQPTKDPMTNLERFIDDAHRDGKYRGSTTVGMSNLRYLGAPAASWEFTWKMDTGVVAHAEDRQAVLPDGTFVAVYWQCPQADWAASHLKRTTAFSSLRID